MFAIRTYLRFACQLFQVYVLYSLDVLLLSNKNCILVIPMLSILVIAQLLRHVSTAIVLIKVVWL